MENENTAMLVEVPVTEMEEVVENHSNNGLKVVTGAGLAIIGGILVYKFIVKPLLRKHRENVMAKNDFDDLEKESEDNEDEDIA